MNGELKRCWVFVSLLVWPPMNAKAQDPVEAITQNLIFKDLDVVSKEHNVSSAGDILVHNREGLGPQLIIILQLAVSRVVKYPFNIRD